MSEQDQHADSIISDQAELETLREGIDDPMVLKEQLRKEADARRQLTARAKKAEEELKSYKTSTFQAESKDVTSNASESKPYEINDEVVDLRLDGYSKGEVEWIMKNGGRKELENPTSYTAIAINARREQEKAERAASQVADTSGISEVERKYSADQLAAMSVKELEAILPKAN